MQKLPLCKVIWHFLTFVLVVLLLLSLYPAAEESFEATCRWSLNFIPEDQLIV